MVLDPTDGKLVHLDGVNLSRAWNLENIAAALPENDPRRASLLAGENDIALAQQTKNGREINRHNYTMDEISADIEVQIENLDKMGLSAQQIAIMLKIDVEGAGKRLVPMTFARIRSDRVQIRSIFGKHSVLPGWRHSGICPGR